MRFKRLITILIALVMVCSSSTCVVFAADENDVKDVKDEPIVKEEVVVPPATEVLKFVKNDTTLTVDWKAKEHVSGYQIQYANNRFFLNAKTVSVKKAKTSSKDIKKVSFNNIYVRVRTYNIVDEKKYYSEWATSSNCRINKTAKQTQIKKAGSKKKAFEIRGLAGEKTGKYDTLQGGVANGKYAWYVLFDRTKNKCKIAKVDMNTKKLVKKSSELGISHGNDLAYNTKRKQLVVCHGEPNYKKISIINPDTLAIEKTVSLTLPKGTPGAKSSDVSGFVGITAIAYNKTHNQYVARVKSLGHFIIYDENFNAVKFVRITKKGGQMYQGLDSVREYIMSIQSPYNGGKYNIITVYDWDGNYVSTVNLSKNYEIECLFHRNGSFYAGYYRPYYKTYYVDGFKIKVAYGKKNKVKTKLKKTKFLRDNYVYKLTGL